MFEDIYDILNDAKRIEAAQKLHDLIDECPAVEDLIEEYVKKRSGPRTKGQTI